MVDDDGIRPFGEPREEAVGSADGQQRRDRHDGPQAGRSQRGASVHSPLNRTRVRRQAGERVEVSLDRDVDSQAASLAQVAQQSNRVWIRDVMWAAADNESQTAEELLRELTWDRRHMFQSAGLFDQIPWKVM